MPSASLSFAHAQGRTRLLRQFVPYPFHITRPFYLDSPRPDLATLYLQSSSGGLYSGEALHLTLNSAPHTAVEVTTQASTLVRHARGNHTTLTTALNLGANSLIFHTPDPLVLFPHAQLTSALTITAEPGAIAIAQESFCLSDPNPAENFPGDYSFTFTLQTPAAKPIVREQGSVFLQTLGTPTSPLGPYCAAGTIYLIGATLAPETIRAFAASCPCPAGASLLPNAAGIALRILAPNGGALAAAMHQARILCFTQAAGFPPAPRRK